VISHILIAYDGSEPADHAARYAADLAKKYDASLSVIAVSHPPSIGDEVEMKAIIENSRKHYQHLLGQLRHKLGPETRAIKLEVKVGHPAEQIIDYAERHNVDLIVLGHKGHTFLERWRLGSISQRVLHYAHCPVLVVR
jgi:nucleotide-binding universal stress UspA family protein